MIAASEPAETTRHPGSRLEVLRIFLRLGLTSFGGPIAHLGNYRSEFVARRKWLDEASFADIVALWQFLPGPASSQVAISIGMLRAGLAGGFAAWLGFTMPSALPMIVFGYGVAWFGDLSHAAWLHGLKIVAVAVVANAVWGMARNLCPDKERATLAVGAAILTTALPSAIGQIGAIAERHLSRRLRRRTGGSRSAVYLRRLSRHGDGSDTERVARWAHLPRGDLPAVAAAAGRSVAVLGLAPSAAGGASWAQRDQRCGRRPAAGGALQSGVDERDPRAGAHVV